MSSRVLPHSVPYDNQSMAETMHSGYHPKNKSSRNQKMHTSLLKVGKERDCDETKHLSSTEEDERSRGDNHSVESSRHGKSTDISSKY